MNTQTNVMKLNIHLDKHDQAALIYSLILHIAVGFFILQWKFSSVSNLRTDHALRSLYIPATRTPKPVRWSKLPFMPLKKPQWREHAPVTRTKNHRREGHAATQFRDTMRGLSQLDRLLASGALDHIPGLSLSTQNSRASVRAPLGLGGIGENSNGVLYASIGKVPGNVSRESRRLLGGENGTHRKSVSIVHIDLEDDIQLTVGHLSKEDILKTLQNHFAHVQYCYEKSLQSNPSLAGKVALNFRILPNGHVGHVTIEKTSMNSPTVESCISRVISQIDFPAPQGGSVDVIFPFMFRRAG